MKRRLDIEQAASNFCSVCGVLAGFSVTLIALLLTPGVVPGTFPAALDETITFLLLSGGLYINGSALLGNVPRVRVTARAFAYNLGVGLFLFANILFAYAFNLLVSTASLSLASAIAKLFTGVCALAFAANFLWPPIAKLLRRPTRRQVESEEAT